MPLISSKTIITSLSLFHIFLGYFLLTNPRRIADHIMVFFLGEAMGMPYSRGFDTQSAPLAFLSFVLISVGLSDLVSLSLPEEICISHHWGTQAPLRLTLSFGFVLYTFLFSASSPFYAPLNPRGRFAHPSAHAHNPGYVPATWGGEAFKNRVFFTFVFLELLTWFWAFLTLREERVQLVQRKAARRRNSGSISSGARPHHD